MPKTQSTATDRASAEAARAEFEQRHPISAPLGQDVPAPRLDSQGNHLQLYGEPSQHASPSTMRRLGVPPALQVASRREKSSHDGRPQVVLFCHDAPFNLDFRLSPDQARALAVSLVDAAEACDTLNRRLAKDCKTIKVHKGTAVGKSWPPEGAAQ